MDSNTNHSSADPDQSADPADLLNEACLCTTLDRGALREALDAEVGSPGFASELMESHPSLFSNVPVFVTPGTMFAMERVVTAVEATLGLPGYRDAALSWAPTIAATDFGPAGALMGYDFHVTPSGPRLIEINTNAGGAFLNSVLSEAQRTCCRGVRTTSSQLGNGFGTAVTAMFVKEWQRQRGSGKPLTIAIVDDEPLKQYLFPEFRLAKATLENEGFVVVITDPMALETSATGLHFDGHQIDLVYNRLVDFGLEEPSHAALRTAYLDGNVVVTPNPHVHALAADKRNLTLLSDISKLEGWDLSPEHREILSAAVPETVGVSPANADALWNDRRNYFFKPAKGHGSKAAYRGDKLTRKVWSEILAAEYVAQQYAQPSERMVEWDGVSTPLKLDIRLYTYAGAVLLAAARLYRGQTTNMRTPGGGFAPLLELVDTPAC